MINTSRVLSSVGNPVDVERLARALLATHDGGNPSGGTFDAHGRAYSGSGLLVATAEHCCELWDDQFDYADAEHSSVLPAIRDWVREVAREVTSRADYWFGAWHDGEGNVYLDVAQSYSDADEDLARRAGIARGQRAIYHAGRRACIELPFARSFR